MISLIMCLFIIMIILFLMLFVNLLISKKMNKNREKMSPFECGFDSMSSNRLPFSLQFYLITIIFLIFDVEIALLLPMVTSITFMYYMMSLNNIIVMIILLVGLYLEMKEGSLNWFKYSK